MLKDLSPSVEDYLSTIYRLDKGHGVRSVDVANTLNVSKPSVNRALKSLVEMEFVTQQPYGDIYLTHLGKEIAIELNKKYSILKGFLVHMLGIDPKKAEIEANQMEHGMSNDTIERIGILIKVYSKQHLQSPIKDIFNHLDQKQLTQKEDTMKDKVLAVMKELGKPVSASEVAVAAGLDKAEVDKVFKQLKKEELIVSPIRCKWEPKQ